MATLSPTTVVNATTTSGCVSDADSNSSDVSFNMDASYVL
jgi:hypothetical protein